MRQSKPSSAAGFSRWNGPRNGFMGVGWVMAFAVAGGVLAGGATAAAAPEPVVPDDAFDVNGTSVACTVNSDCWNTSVCRDGWCYVPKNRFVSVKPHPTNAGSLTARRVCVDEPGNLCSWVGEPISYSPTGPGPLPVLVSDLVAEPVYRDWSLDPVDSQGRIVVHISGCKVSPIHTYLIQSIHQGDSTSDEASYSLVLSLPTTGRWADVVGSGSPASPPDDVPNFGDVQHAIFGFLQDQKAPKTWLKIGASSVASNPSMIGMAADVLQVILAKQGGTYPGLQPYECCNVPEGGCP